MSEERIPKSGEIYKHFKNKLYQIVTIAEHSETGEKLVIYQALYGTFKVYARPLYVFTSEVDHVKYPEVEQKFRFALQKVIQENEFQTEEICNSFTSAEAADKTFSLYDFLDANTYKEKIEIFRKMRKDINEKTINDIAVSLDIVVDDGEAEERCQSILNCLTTMARFETDRLR